MYFRDPRNQAFKDRSGVVGLGVLIHLIYLRKWFHHGQISVSLIQEKPMKIYLIPFFFTMLNQYPCQMCTPQTQVIIH